MSHEYESDRDNGQDIAPKVDKDFETLPKFVSHEYEMLPKFVNIDTKIILKLPKGVMGLIFSYSSYQELIDKISKISNTIRQ